MVAFINALTGSKMWVAENRAEEYKAAGHRPVVEAAPDKPAEKPKRTAKPKK